MSTESQMSTIESLLDSYWYAYDRYANSTTCNSDTYAQQYKEMLTARRVLLEFFELNLKPI